MRGVLRCARYAFSPNKLKYCGPNEKSYELSSYLAEGVADQGLNELLDDFGVMYPYLKLIADENGIDDPFDERVVEAYWIGNELLEKVRLKGFWDHLLEKRHLKKRFKPKDLKWIINKVPQGAKVHHSFHVMNIWNKTDHEAKPEAVETMNSCRISWGRVKQVKKDKVMVETQELVYKGGVLDLKDGVEKEVSWRLGDKGFVKKLKKEDLVTIHWGWVCEKITKQQRKSLEKYTKWHIRLANTTL